MRDSKEFAFYLSLSVFSPFFLSLSLFSPFFFPQISAWKVLRGSILISCNKRKTKVRRLMETDRKVIDFCKDTSLVVSLPSPPFFFPPAFAYSPPPPPPPTPNIFAYFPLILPTFPILLLLFFFNVSFMFSYFICYFSTNTSNAPSSPVFFLFCFVYVSRL